MPDKHQWLKKQRVSGGTSWTSSIIRGSADTSNYVEHITNIVSEQAGLSLRVRNSPHGFEVYLNNQIVWFGRDVDVELMRATSVSWFEDYLHQRLERLEDLKLIDRKI